MNGGYWPLKMFETWSRVASVYPKRNYDVMCEKNHRRNVFFSDLFAGFLLPLTKRKEIKN